MGHGKATQRSIRVFWTVVLSLVAACLASWGGDTLAAPEAHILRIDPRTGLKNGQPLLTTVIEIVQFKRLSDTLQP
jgi:hypothetical protein